MSSDTFSATWFSVRGNVMNMPHGGICTQIAMVWNIQEQYDRHPKRGWLRLSTRLLNT